MFKIPSNVSYRDLLIVVLAIIVSFTGTTAYRLSIPAVAFYSRSVLESTMLQIGALTAAFFITRASSSAIIGVLIDKGIKPKYIAPLCFAIHATVLYLYTYAPSWIYIIILRALQGWLNGFAWVSIQYMLGASVPSSIRGRVYSLYFSIGGLGTFAGNALYSLIYQQDISLTLHRAVIISSTLMILTAIFTIFFAKASSDIAMSSISKKSMAKKHEVTINHKPRSFILYILISVVSIRFYSSLLYGDIIYVYIVEALKLNPGLVTLLIGSIDVISMIMSFAISWVADRLSDVLALRVITITLVSGAILFCIMNIGTVIFGLTLASMASRSFTPIIRRIAMTYTTSRGTAIGLVNAFGNAASALGSIAIGRLLDIFYISVIVLMNIPVTISIGLVTSISLLGILPSSIQLMRNLWTHQ